MIFFSFKFKNKL